MTIKTFYKDGVYTPWVDYAMKNDPKGLKLYSVRADLGSVPTNNCDSNGSEMAFLRIGIPTTDSSTAWTWGFNNFGQLGDNTTINRSSPTSVVGGHSFKQISLSLYHGVAIKADGTAWQWGQINSTSSPVSVVGNHSFIKIRAICNSGYGAYQSIGLKSDGSAWTWGMNYYGELGNNATATATNSPVSVVGNHSFMDIMALACGAIKANGSLWLWGPNSSNLSYHQGRIGDNTTINRSSSVSVVGGYNFIQASLNFGGISYALTNSGDVYNWGYGAGGGITSSPISVATGSNKFIQIARGGSGFVGLKSDGTIWNLGTSQLSTESFNQIFSNGGNVYCIKEDGSVLSLGGNSLGTLGDCNSVDRLTSPVNVSTLVPFFGDTSATDPATIGGAGTDHITLLKPDGSAWSWGLNTSGQLGNNTTNNTFLPVSVVGGHSFTKIFSCFYVTHALKSDGSAWSWGYNQYGPIGDNSAFFRSSPVSVVGGHSFTKLCGGDLHTVGLRGDNTAWSWGYNYYGQLGDNTSADKSSPVSVVGGHVFTDIQAGAFQFTIGLRSDNTVWSWGNNSYGSLGDNTTTKKATPTSVVGGHLFTKIATGQTTVLALKSDGSMWAWGNNYVGDGTAIMRSSPVSVLGNHSFVAMAGTGQNNFAIKADGSMWGWGNGSTYVGDLGGVVRLSPVSVVGNHSFISLFAARDNTQVYAIKTDGSIWSMGANTFGELGACNLINRSSPVSVTQTSPCNFKNLIP